MKTLILTLALATSLTAVSPLFAASQELGGTLNITILDENGAIIPDAPIYIYGEHKTRFVGGKEIPGTATLEMPAGDYRISSAVVKRTGDYFDRYASHEAHVKIVPGDNTVITLTLRPVDDPMNGITTAELRKIGVGTDIAKNLSNLN